MNGRKLCDPTKTIPKVDIDVSWLAAAHSNQKVIHLVRDPRKVIASLYDRGFLDRGTKVDEFARRVSGIKETGLEGICKFYYRWNKMIEPRAVIRLKLEDMGGKPTNVRPSGKTVFEWQDLPDYVKMYNYEASAYPETTLSTRKRV